MLHMVFPWPWLMIPTVQLLLSLPVYAIGFWFFGKSAWSSLKTGVPNMDVLIFIGAASAFFYSFYGTLLFAGTHQVHEYLFYETGATIITLVLLGNLLEKRSVKKTTNAIQALSALQVKTARLVEEHNGHTHVKDVPVEILKPGQILLVNTGEVIPMDGLVVEGEGYADESMITGEALAKRKNPETNVLAGTILNEGNIKMEVKATLKESMLAQIIEMVKKAQANKPSIQKLGDRVSAVFVPVVVGIAILTFLVSFFILDLSSSQSMLRAVAVLVISCPCAMGLATPTAVMVGIGRAARKGILIKGGDTLEEFAKTKTIVFDKTGTLSTGNFTLEQSRFKAEEEQKLKAIIYSMESYSLHPLAKAIVAGNPHWNQPLAPWREINEVKGKGIQATDTEGNTWKLGSAEFTGINNRDEDIFLTCNENEKAALRISDEMKENADKVIRYFKDQGMECVLLSGDAEKKVSALAQSIEIKQWKARQLPSDKLSFIETHTHPEHLLAMVGDGINDAPSLSKASVGISFAKGSDIAIQSASIVLMRPGIDALQEAHQISKLTYKTIKQNLFWALFYNVLCIPLAAAGFMHPMLGALSMAFSDVIVIGNSLLLNIKKTKALG